MGLFSALGVSLIGEPVSAGDVYTAILLPRYGARPPPSIPTLASP